MFSFDVRVSEGLDALLLRCRDGADEVGALRVLHGALPKGAVRRSAQGIRVDPKHAHRLTSPDVGVEVRWTDTTRRYLANRQAARTAYPVVRKALRTLVSEGVERARWEVSDSPGLDVLDDHQVVNVAAMTLPEAFGLCLFDEQGTGKTVSLIFSYDLLAARDQTDQMLIVAPKSMVPEWCKDFERFRPGLYRVTPVTGSAREKRAALRTRSDVYVTNFEAVVSMEKYFEALLRPRPDRSVLAVDESFFVKSPDAKRTKALRRLRESCGRAFVLCGTPAPNAPHDLVEQFNLVDFGIAFEGVQLPPDRAEALPVVRKVVEERGLYVRHLKADVLPDLPARSFHRLYVPLRPEQGRVYTRLRDRLVTDLRSVSDAAFRRDYATFLARRSALLQVCSNPTSVVRGYDETPAKLLLLDELLEQWINLSGEKVVLWSFYTASLDALVARYAKFGAIRYDGTVTAAAARGEAVRRFQEEEEVRLFVANPAAAGAGLTLHRARLVVYESMSNQAAHYLQSLDRVHRRGQGREVEYVVILCEDTLETVEYDRLLEKQRAAGDLLGDDAPPVTRESFLRDLSAETATANGDMV